jgi:uncharacterized protein
MEKIEILESRLPGLYKNNSCDHDMGHIRRVVRNAKIVGGKEGADLSVLIPAAMLHDIALKRGSLSETNDRHAVLGAGIAEKILKELGFEKIKEICSTIMQHSIDSPTSEPRTKEGDCLFDADKLDAIKPVGTARYLQEKALVDNMGPVESAEKCMKWLRTFEFRTETGREMGKDRAEVIRFCEEIIKSGKV